MIQAMALYIQTEFSLTGVMVSVRRFGKSNGDVVDCVLAGRKEDLVR